MKVLFIHQNMPGQFGRLAQYLSHQPEVEVAFISARGDRPIKDVLLVQYRLANSERMVANSPGDTYTLQIERGIAVLRACETLVRQGFNPDVIIGHPGWGELLFVKDYLPRVPLISYCEFYHNPAMQHLEGDPPREFSPRKHASRRAQSAHLLLSLEAADRGWSPTNWQKGVHPEAYHDKIDVVFDGVDTDAISPDPTVSFTLPGGRVLSSADEVVTYAARSLEPCRGFPNFCRALPSILRQRPEAQIVIAGDSAPHYDLPPRSGETWMESVKAELDLDATRVHFVGSLPREQFTSLLQISRVHTYLTSPIVLSWSLVEAISAGCLIVASDTPPVKEFIEDNVNGFLTDFLSPNHIASDVLKALSHSTPGLLRENARRLATERLSLRVCIPQIWTMIESAISGRRVLETSRPGRPSG